MDKIKYIHCFGTSYTAGGGYEFYSSAPNKINLLPFYKDCGEELTQYNFSYAGQLQKLLEKNNHPIKVINHAKSGYGNERMYRKTFDIILSKDFKKEENFFLFEFAYLGSKEFWINHFNDYGIFNYNFDSKTNKMTFDNALDYYSDSEKTRRFNKKLGQNAKPFLEEILNKENQEYIVTMYDIFFCNFIKFNNLNYLYSQPPWAEHKYFRKNIFTVYKDNSDRNETLKLIFKNPSDIDEGFVSFFHNNNLNITSETGGLVEDGHMSLYGAKIVSTQIYNKLIDIGVIKNDYLNLPDKINFNN